MVDYEGVIPRFYRVYLQRDITKLKKKMQEEIMSHVRHGFCRTCGGTGLNPKALASKINGKNIVECMDMTAADLLPFLNTIDDKNPYANLEPTKSSGVNTAFGE